MIFTKLKLTNFKSHKDTVIDFNKGINIIVGENGAGKSTILEGISFALFKQHTAKKIDDLVRNNTKNMKVELEFSCYNGEYKIIREKKSNLQSTLYQKQNNEFIPLTSGDKEVTEKIQSILDLDADLFLNAIYIRQGEISNLITKTASEKKQLIGKLLGINSFENAWKNILPFINDYEKQSMELQGKLYDSDKLHKEFKDKLDELQTLKLNVIEEQLDIENIEKELEHLNEENQEYQKQFLELDSLNANLKEINQIIEQQKQNFQEVSTKTKQIEQAENKIQELKDYPKKYDTYLKNEQKFMLLNELKSSEQELIDNINYNNKILQEFLEKGSQYFDQKYDDINKLRYVAEITISEHKTNKKINDDKINEKKSLILSAKSQKKTFEESLNKLQDIDAECPICHSTINDKDKKDLNKFYNDNIESLNKEIHTLDTDIKDANIISNNLEKKIQELTSISQQGLLMQGKVTMNDALSEKLKNKQEEIAQYNFDENDFSEDNKTFLKNKSEEYHKLIGFIENKDTYLNKLTVIDQELSSNITKHNKIKQQIEESSYDSQLHSQVKDKIKLYEKNKNKKTQCISTIHGQALMLIRNLYDIIEKLNFVEKTKQDYNNIAQYIQSLNDIRDLYSKNGIQKQLRDLSKPLIEKHTKEFFNQFNFSYSDLYLDDDYNVIVYGPEGESSVNMISGGEKVAIALALRLGITKTISGNELDTILLDEPTIFLDDARKYDLFNLLQHISILPQMIIVTHESQLENIADNLISIEKENGISKIVNGD